MNQYLAVLRDVLDNGYWQEDARTGIPTKVVSGTSMRFDLADGFPAVTTKQLFYKSVVGELVGFMRGVTSAADFRALGCNVWNTNANVSRDWLANPYRDGEDDLGAGLYGAAWRRWPAYKRLQHEQSRQIDHAEACGYTEIARDADSVILYREIDQMADCLRTLIHNPTSRRMVFHAMNPAEIDAIALPPCHVMYTFNANPTARELSLTLSCRSSDCVAGVPFNAASAASILSLFARLAGYTPRHLTLFMSDTHIYENHVAAAQEQLTREPMPLPGLAINERIPSYDGTNEDEVISWLDRVEPTDFTLTNYKHHPAIKVAMAA